MDPNTPNSAPQNPADAGVSSQPAPEAGVPQNQDKSDAMTYPLGSQSAQPGADPTQPAAAEDHRSILERIMGIFSRGKKDQPQEAAPTPVDQTPTNATPPPGQ